MVDMSLINAYANLCGAKLQGADLKGADLQGANLQGANLQCAALQGANFYGRKPIHCDTARNYVLYVIEEVKDGPRFFAGCRNFTYEEAIQHWEKTQPAYVQAINRYVGK